MAALTPLLEVRHLLKHYAVRGSLLTSVRRTPPRLIRAVDDVSFHLAPHETLGLVGESGCGKTTLGFLILGLLQPSAGRISFEGEDVTRPSRNQLRRLRKDIQIIFQDPFASLDPRQKVEEIIREPLDIHSLGSPTQRRVKVKQLMDLVALPQRYGSHYPHELSGGLRQRVGIAAALAVEPKLLVADEPTSALDASVQAEIINLLIELQRETGIAYLFISHNLDVVRHVSHRVAVMYLGKIVEIGPVERVYGSPHHPYTQALLSAIPIPDPGRAGEPIRLSGEVPSPIDVPSGCPFHPRCWLAEEICMSVPPGLTRFGPDHFASCHVAARHSQAEHGRAVGKRARKTVRPPGAGALAARDARVSGDPGD